MPSLRHAPTTSTILSAPLPSAWLVMRRSNAGVKRALGMATTTRIRPALPQCAAASRPTAVLCCATSSGSMCYRRDSVWHDSECTKDSFPPFGCARIAPELWQRGILYVLRLGGEVNAIVPWLSHHPSLRLCGSAHAGSTFALLRASVTKVSALEELAAHALRELLAVFPPHPRRTPACLRLPSVGNS